MYVTLPRLHLIRLLLIGATAAVLFSSCVSQKASASASLDIRPAHARLVGGWHDATSAEQWFTVDAPLGESVSIVQRRVRALGWRICPARVARFHDNPRSVTANDPHRPRPADSSIYMVRKKWSASVAMYNAGPSTRVDARFVLGLGNICGT